jgi:ribosomal protein S12 methylthiotransferase accessory factor
VRQSACTARRFPTWVRLGNGVVDFKLTGWRMRENASSPSVNEAIASKTFLKGTHRTIAPEQTIARMEPLLPAFGITRIANLTGLDRIGLPVIMVCRPNARSSAVFHGKGLDVAAAKASGIMEAVETWHAEHTRLPLRLETLAELRRSENVADVRRLPLTVASRFDDDLPMLWAEGDDLIARERMWVPFEAIHMDATLGDASGAGCFAASTNGLASGNHLLEAISHSLCEVIERDATSLWRRRQPSRRDGMRLDLATVGDEACRSVLDRLYEAELEVAVWDVTTDVGVPAFQCLMLDRTGEISHLGQGSGCHPASEIALLRALTEAVQVRTTYIVGSREDIRHDDYFRETLDARLRSARLLMRPVDAMRDFGALPSFLFGDLRIEVDWILDRLGSAGIRQAVAVDLTRPEYGVPVVRAVIPGLEGSDHIPDYAPGERARAAEHEP